jgi:hypothetical protein
VFKGSVTLWLKGDTLFKACCKLALPSRKSANLVFGDTVDFYLAI